MDFLGGSLFKCYQVSVSMDSYKQSTVLIKTLLATFKVRSDMIYYYQRITYDVGTRIIGS